MLISSLWSEVQRDSEFLTLIPSTRGQGVGEIRPKPKLRPYIIGGSLETPKDKPFHWKWFCGTFYDAIAHAIIRKNGYSSGFYIAPTAATQHPAHVELYSFLETFLLHAKHHGPLNPISWKPEGVNVSILFQGVFLCTLRVCTLGLGSLNHGLWPFIRLFGTKKLKVAKIKGTNL